MKKALGIAAIVLAVLFVIGLFGGEPAPADETLTGSYAEDVVSDALENTEEPSEEITEMQTEAVTETESASDTTETNTTEKPIEAPTSELQTTEEVTSSESVRLFVGAGEAAPIALSEVPAYSGNASIEVNGNVPNFSAEELTTIGYETYSELDPLGRCGAAFASVGPELMPTEERGSIGMIKPSGWQLVKYDCVDGKYLYNRCHLIGYQLTAENANVQNLITGTRYLNMDGMLPYENRVADYVKDTGNHVAYRATPLFEGNNLLAHGVQLEAYSIEDEGAGICFNVFCYNVQPGITIDYATGESIGPAEEETSSFTASESLTEAPTEAPTVAPEPEPSESEKTTDYVLNTNTKKFHYASCSSAKQIKETNKGYYSGTRDELIAMGYDPCGRCLP